MEGRVITAITSLEASLLHSSKAFTFFCSVQIYRFRQAVMKDKRESDTLRKALAFYPNFPFKVCIHFTCCFLLFWCLASWAFWKIVLRTSAYSSRRSCCHWKRKPKFPGSTFSLWKKKSFHTCALFTLFHKVTFCPKYWSSSSPKNLFWIEIKQLTLILKRQTNSCKYPPKSRNYRNWIFFNTLWTLCQLLNSVLASTKLLESLSIYIEKIWICIFLSCWSFRKNPPKNA